MPQEIPPSLVQLFEDIRKASCDADAQNVANRYVREHVPETIQFLQSMGLTRADIEGINGTAGLQTSDLTTLLVATARLSRDGVVTSNIAEVKEDAQEMGGCRPSAGPINRNALRDLAGGR